MLRTCKENITALMHQLYINLPNYWEMCKKMENKRIPIWYPGLDRKEGRQPMINFMCRWNYWEDHKCRFQLNRPTTDEIFCMCQILERKHGINGPVCYLQDINTTCASERKKIQHTHETNEINLLEFQL